MTKDDWSHYLEEIRDVLSHTYGISIESLVRGSFEEKLLKPTEITFRVTEYSRDGEKILDYIIREAQVANSPCNLSLAVCEYKGQDRLYKYRIVSRQSLPADRFEQETLSFLERAVGLLRSY